MENVRGNGKLKNGNIENVGKFEKWEIENGNIENFGNNGKP